MKRILYLFALLFFSINIFATHNRAGEITYKQIGPRTFEVTITTYTKQTPTGNEADRCELTINWGDNTTSVLKRENGPAGPNCLHMGVMVENNIKKNIYRKTHTYPANDTYVIHMLDPNRNDGVLNIHNSVNEPFFIQSIIKIGTGLGTNSSPTLLNPPTDFGCVHTPFTHNVSAYDGDGDSLSYKMVDCRGANGRELTTTYSPEYNLDKVMVDNKGTITWASPLFAGEYNIAIEISEHRKDPLTGRWITIGRILRDMQIDILKCTNNPPEIETPESFCVIGGEQLKFTVTATDEDNDKVTLSAVGGPFQQNPPKPNATFPELINKSTPVYGDFIWNTNCNLARRSPYQVTFKADDHPLEPDGDPLPGLSTQKIVEITILAPGVKNLSAEENPNTANFNLSWDKTTCNNAKGYKIFRKEHSGEFEINDCESGVPDGSGYELIAEVNNIEQTNYTDDNGNNPFKTGVLYCYTITTILYDDSESIPSDYACTTLKKRLPVITNVDIETTGYSENIQGEINIIWSKPTEIDEVQHPGPYAYKLLRSEGVHSNDFIEIEQFNNINDTVYLDRGMDTYSNGYNYRVDFYNNTGGNLNEVGKGYPASSPYLKVISGDTKLQLKIEQEVPWRIDSIIYYKEIDQSEIFERIAKTNGDHHIVEDLENGKEYCFKADVYGSYSVEGYVKPLLNRSQIGCGTPNINNLTCPPTLYDIKDCGLNIYTLFWTNPNTTCNEDIIGYKLYHSLTETGEYKILETLYGEDNTEYNVIANNIPAGCFYVTAIDALGNETMGSNIKCYVPCIDFILPNIFTPNGDGINDIYHPKWDKDSGVDHDFDFNIIEFDIEIYNRWGNLVYKTNQIEINWDGTNQLNGKACATGVYYYVCTIRKTEGDQEPSTVNLTGYIHLNR